MQTVFIFLPILLTFTLIGVYVERKLSAFIQDRLGPMHTGSYGLLQTIADMLKLLQKEDIVPTAADKLLFKIAPIFIFATVFTAFSVIPLNAEMVGSTAEVGIFFGLSIVSLDIIGILLAGWASANKYSLYGAVRAVAQIISYEIPLTLSVLSVIILYNDLDLQYISIQQGIFAEKEQYLFGIKYFHIKINEIGGITAWTIAQSPLSILPLLIFFITSLAQSNRAPFDLPEAESELVGGFHTEYSGFRWAILMLSEYSMMCLTALLTVILFLGSWNTPLPNISVLKLATWTSGTPHHWSSIIFGSFWLCVKTIIVVLIQMWIRWTYPRLRIDQTMTLCWKYLLPFSIFALFCSTLWKILMTVG